MAISPAPAYDEEECELQDDGSEIAVTKTEGHPDDVSIGRDEWIRFVDVSGRTGNAVGLDAYLRPLEAFWRSLEVNCVSECCGINAHGFWPQDIWNAVRNADDPELQPKLAALRRHVDSISADCVSSHILNQYFDRLMFCKLLDHVIATINRM